MTADSIGLDGGVGLYGYVGGDPIGNIDYTGLNSMECYLCQAFCDLKWGILCGSLGSIAAGNPFVPALTCPFIVTAFCNEVCESKCPPDKDQCTSDNGTNTK